jgi:toxin ParE1/3/4
MILAFSPAAQADFGVIWDYSVETWGEDQADRYIDLIRDTCTLLARGEREGRRFDLRAGYLKYPFGRHLVFFRKTTSGIEVVRILHQSMDVARHL